MKPLLVAVMGPTASGKTELAERLADQLDAELVNADAFQAYRGMDIGTAKPADRARYRLIDLKNPDEGYGVGEFVSLAHELLGPAHAGGKSVVVVGGTGLYIRALFEGYQNMAAAPDPELRRSLQCRLGAEGLGRLAADLAEAAPEVAARTDLRNPARVLRALERLQNPVQVSIRPLPDFQRIKLALAPAKDHLFERIERRVRMMVQNNWILEVETLRAAGYGPVDPGFRAIGYRAMFEHIEGRVELEEAVATTIAETRRYAKRQRTWLNSEPNLEWLGESDPVGQALARVRFELN